MRHSALPGMDEADIQTPCLILDLDALERNIRKMGDYAARHGMRHRNMARCKTVDVQKLRKTLAAPSASGCQKVSEAEVSPVAASRTFWSAIRSAIPKDRPAGQAAKTRGAHHRLRR